ncbi:hypothetical protein Cfor_06458 [Coptotermes formosanus]|uniref:Uncharacterized protein n=1 Tax=Coptotermes formosanus TaxID=36987 RepID=A0A6L2Q5F1_COPFO|nr:hypothetical protein Cfor_06458 [Coptotermes formosanus]
MYETFDREVRIRLLCICVGKTSFLQGRKHSLRPSGGRGVPEPEYDAWRAERNRIDSDRISRQRTAEGHWRREWDNEKLTQEEDVREAARVSRGGGSRRTNVVRNPYGDHGAHTEECKCVRSGDHSLFRSSRVRGNVRGGHGVSRGCRGNTQGARHVDTLPVLDSREESTAVAHSERSVISVGESLKISVPNDTPTSFRHVQVSAPVVAGTGRVGPRQTLRISYSSQSEDEAPSRRVELQPSRTSFSKDKARSDACSHSTVSDVSKPPLPPSAGVKLDSEPKTQRVKRLRQDSKVKKREKKEISVSEISKFVDKKEEAAVLTLAGCQKETESGGEDSWEDITTSGNDSACEELSPHSNTDSILDVTSTKVKSEVPENTGEMSPNPEIKSKMLQIGEFKSEVLQHTVEKPEVLQNTKVKVGMFQNAEVQPEMLHNPELKPDVLQDTEMKPDVLQDTEVRSGVLQNTEMRSEVLQNTEMISEVLQNTDMKSDMLQNIAGRTGVLQNMEMRSEVIQNTDVKSDVLQNTAGRTGVLQNTEMRSEVIQNTDVKSDVLQNTEGRSEVLQNTEVRSEVLQNTEVRSETLQTVGSVLNNDADDSTEVTQVIVNENLPDAVIQDILEKRCTSFGSTEYAQLRDISEICFEKSLSDTLAETKAETVNESTELTEVEDISLVTECKGERLESEIKIEPEKRCRQNEQPGKVDVTETSGSAAANSLPEEKEGPV